MPAFWPNAGRPFGFARHIRGVDRFHGSAPRRIEEGEGSLTLDELRDLIDQFRLVGKAARLELGVDQLAVEFDFKASSG